MFVFLGRCKGRLEIHYQHGDVVNMISYIIGRNIMGFTEAINEDHDKGTEWGGFKHTSPTPSKIG